MSPVRLDGSRHIYVASNTRHFSLLTEKPRNDCDELASIGKRLGGFLTDEEGRLRVDREHLIILLF